jgi:hypothetical protein
VTTGGAPLADATVYAYRPGAWLPTRVVATTADGTFSLDGLADGTYQVRFSADGSTAQWFDGVTTRAAATPIGVTAGSPTTGIDGDLSPS